jgi:hypothetical protein
MILLEIPLETEGDCFDENGLFYPQNYQQMHSNLLYHKPSAPQA